jgi:ABC-type uncharacterized transport system substrate-binding protein
MRRAPGVVVLLVIALLAGGAAATAYGHPHVFIDGRVAFEFSRGELATIEVEWRFDELFSSMIQNDYDRNRNGRFDRQEIDEVERGAFSNLKYFNYFTYLVVDGERIPTEEVQDFRVDHRDGRMRYRFRIPVSAGLERARTVQVMLYDETYFTDIALLREYASVRGTVPATYEISTQPMEAFSYSYGPATFVPEAIQLTYEVRR